MRKSIKAVSAMACAVAVALTATFVPAVEAKAEMVTTVETLTDEANTSYEAIDPYSIVDEKYYTIGGGSTEIQWAPLAVTNVMEETSFAGVVSKTLTLPAFDEDNASANEFKMCTIDNTVYGDGWDHSLIAGTTYYGDNMSRFRVACEEETEITVYWDTTTGAVVVLDKDGEEVDYLVSLVGYDNELVWKTPAEVSKASWSEYAADKAAIAQGAGATSIPDLESANKALAAKIAGGAGESTETTAAETSAATQTSAAATETSAAATTTAATTTAATTTAANTAAKTGDTVPVAMVVTLCAAAAIVVVAKKKEA